MLPWSGGTSRVTPIEGALSGVAASLAGSGATVRWPARGVARARRPRRLRRRRDVGNDAARGRAGVGSATGGLLDPCAADLSAASGVHGRARRAGSKICRHGASGRSPVLGECDGWGATLVAVHVLGHESIHLAGVVDEATADCLAVQVDAQVAMRLGANRAFARSLARDYWRTTTRRRSPAIEALVPRRRRVRPLPRRQRLADAGRYPLTSSSRSVARDRARRALIAGEQGRHPFG